MPRVPRRALIWSQHHQCYEAFRSGQLEARGRPADDAALQIWLREGSSFAFHGRSGSLNVYEEQRARGGPYWYAYHTGQGRTRKRYLGPTEHISLARLEETAQDLAQEQKPSLASEPGDLVTTFIVTSRLAPPRLPTSLVKRPRLLSALDGVLSTPLTLVSAPAGWGKTTLLAAWASERSQRSQRSEGSRHTIQVAWLSLDELDNSETHFWVALISALRRCAGYDGRLGATALALLQSPQPPPLLVCVSALVNELEGQATRSVSAAPVTPIVLIVDDYQVVSDPALHESLQFFVEHQPPALHVILASRVDPDLPLARWRARGQLAEIRADELRFNLEEASQFLRQMLAPAQPLSDGEVQQLSLRAEGWIVGLQLAALALQKRADGVDRAEFLQALTGSQRYLLDYVREDILARLPTRQRDCLLQIAILSHLDAAACQAVTAASDRRASQQLLEELERANLFLMPLDEERRWYRLHDLFREALLAVLATSHPDLVPELHRRAARFYEAQRQWPEAIGHWLAAADFSAAARLMEQAAEQFWLRGEAAAMAHWVLALPTHAVREHARLVLTTALYLLFAVSQATREQRARAYVEARQLMALVETALNLGPLADGIGYQGSALSAPVDAGGHSDPSADQETAATEHALLRRRLRLLSMFLDFLDAIASGDHARLNSMQQEIQEALDQNEEAIWRMVSLSCSFVLHFTVWQEAARLLPRLLDARAWASRSGSHFATIKVRQWLTLAAMDAGRLRLAYDESQAALGLIEQIAGYVPLKGYFEIAQAAVLYQWNRVDEARSMVHRLVHDAARWQQLDVLSWGYVTLMQVELVRGDWSAAEQAQHEVERLVQREGYGGYADLLPTMRAQGWLARGHLEAAADWAASTSFPEGTWAGPSTSTFPVLMRVYFAQQRWSEALALLERWRGHLDRPANTAMTITYLAQYLVALHHAGRHEAAQRIAARLFALTEPENYVRVYLDEGEPMRQTLQMLLTPRSQQPSSATTTYVAKLLAAFQHETPGVSAFLEIAPSRSLSPNLTRRECEVLRLLATGASNQEIAHTLVISLPTVKKHVSNLLGKLGATSRTQAIVQARARSLL